MYSGYESKVEPKLFVPQLYSQGIISEKTFSFYMTNLSGQSYIDFGTPDASIIGDGSSLFWLDKDQTSQWWSNEVRGMKWGSGDDLYETAFNPTTAVTDTGTSCIVGPSEYANLIYNHILA